MCLRGGELQQIFPLVHVICGRKSREIDTDLQLFDADDSSSSSSFSTNKEAYDERVGKLQCGCLRSQSSSNNNTKWRIGGTGNNVDDACEAMDVVEETVHPVRSSNDKARCLGVEDAFNDSWSSEDEEDRRFPSSIRSLLKRAFTESMKASNDTGTASLLSEDATEKCCIKGAQDDMDVVEISASSSFFRRPRELPVVCMEFYTTTAGEIDIPMPSASEDMPVMPKICTHVNEEEAADSSHNTEGRSGMKQKPATFPCRLCGHIFSQRKTRDLHAKVCR